MIFRNQNLFKRVPSIVPRLSLQCFVDSEVISQSILYLKLCMSPSFRLHALMSVTLEFLINMSTQISMSSGEKIKKINKHVDISKRHSRVIARQLKVVFSFKTWMQLISTTHRQLFQSKLSSLNKNPHKQYCACIFASKYRLDSTLSMCQHDEGYYYTLTHF